MPITHQVIEAKKLLINVTQKRYSFPSKHVIHAHDHANLLDAFQTKLAFFYEVMALNMN